MPKPEFWYEEATSGPVLHGPDVVIALDRANGFRQTLSVNPARGEVGAAGNRDPVFRVCSAADSDGQPLDPTQVLNPVYQELIRHDLLDDLGPGLCVLLTGAYYEHHFSAVFRLRRDPAKQLDVVFDVDVADRCRAPVTKLAATYQVFSARPGFARVSPVSLRWEAGPGHHGSLEIIAVAPSSIAVWNPTVAVPYTQVEVATAIHRKTHTHRLHYCWRWTS
jgi:hypothetical protein